MRSLTRRENSNAQEDCLAKVGRRHHHATENETCDYPFAWLEDRGSAFRD